MKKSWQTVDQKARCLSLLPSRVVVGMNQPHTHRLRHNSQPAWFALPNILFCPCEENSSIETVFLVGENALIENQRCWC